ncbi:imm11 family protein [Candidatus Cardinium hertigii]|uniref:imm11 family protein n=1 Tax=Candidatus Cardinium hertigii TaxID=247481 RepID=UPI003D7DEEC1
MHFLKQSPLLVHKTILDKFNSLCPEQFESFPVIVTNKDGKKPEFVNRNFYLMNLFNLIDAVDLEESIPSEGYEDKDPINDIVYWDKLVFKENPWPEGVLIGRNLYSSASVLFHPSLAKHFIKDKITFFTDELLTKYGFC